MGDLMRKGTAVLALVWVLSNGGKWIDQGELGLPASMAKKEKKKGGEA